MTQGKSAPRLAPSGREIPEFTDPKLLQLVHGIIAQVADKWTLLILEELEEAETLRFSELSRRVPGISQKMLTQTLREMERDGFVSRKVYPVIPPRVEYRLTDLGLSLSAAFCSVWEWAATHHGAIETARKAFAERASAE